MAGAVVGLKVAGGDDHGFVFLGGGEGEGVSCFGEGGELAAVGG